MDLRDVMRLVGRHWYIVVVVTLAATGVAAAIVLPGLPPVEKGFTATSNVVVNTQLAGARGVATSMSREFNGQKSGYTATVGADGNLQLVAITVKGPEGNACVQHANDLAQKLVDEAEPMFSVRDGVQFAARVEAAKSATAIVPKAPDYSPIWITAIIALGVGIIIVTTIGKVRRPVMDVEGVQDVAGLPVLEALPAPDGKRLLANVRFAADKDVGSISVVPVRSDKATGKVCELLADAAKGGNAEPGKPGEAASLKVAQCKPITNDLGCIYTACDADAVLVCVERWKDTITALKSTLAELRIAGANLVGIVYVAKNK